MTVPISAQTALVGVLGDPVRHSLSPAMHNAALAAMGLDWVYLALPVAAADLAGAVGGLEALGCLGLNVTLPHKRAVAALAAELTPLAERLGAVNTLVRRPGGGWLGTNTDVAGFLAPLRETAPALPGGRAVVLGCGGSARAVLAALVELDLDRIELAGRRQDQLESLLESCAGWAPRLRPLPWPDGGDAAFSQALAGADLVVNTTPVGMAGAAGSDEACPLGPEQLDALGSACLIYDLIYTPRPSRLLREAGRRGCPTLDGLEMLVRQGAASLELWGAAAGQALPVPVATMRHAALAQLEGRGGGSRGQAP